MVWGSQVCSSHCWSATVGVFGMARWSARIQQRFSRFLKDEVQATNADPRTISKELEELSDAISSPAQKLEQRLHGVVAFGIIPLLAFANTGLLAWDTVRLGWAMLPSGVSW